MVILVAKFQIIKQILQTINSEHLIMVFAEKSFLCHHVQFVVTSKCPRNCDTRFPLVHLQATWLQE
jgi:hypothetical protein